MADRQNILGKIRALLNTADEDSGATEGERSNAIAMVQKLMTKHRIEEHELAKADGRKLLPGIIMADGGDYKQGRLWIGRLMQAIAEPMTVDVVYGRYVGGARITLVGRPESIGYVKLVRDWIVPQLMRECDTGMDRDRTGAINAGMPWTFAESIRYKRSFYFGAVGRLRDRLAPEGDEGVGTEIVLSDRAAIDEAYELAGMDIRTKAVSTASLDTFAAMAGESAGNRVDIDPRNKVQGAPKRGLSA